MSLHISLRLMQVDLLAKQSKCVRRGVGALLINSVGDLVAEGYNGMFKGGQNTCGLKEGECLREGLCSGASNDVGCFHAEMNALFHCARSGRSTQGCAMVCNTYPCVNCARAVVQCGISSFHTWEGSYPSEEGLRLLQLKNIPVTLYSQTTNGVFYRAY